jgi:hypothetical protein
VLYDEADPVHSDRRRTRGISHHLRDGAHAARLWWLSLAVINRLLGNPCSVPKSPVGSAVAEGQALVADDIPAEDDEHQQREREFSRRELLRAGWAVPVAVSLGGLAAACSGGGHSDSAAKSRSTSASTTTAPGGTSTTQGAHADAAHTDTPHTDGQHNDGGHADHADAPHSDTPHADHSDAPHDDHGDGGHADHADTPHADTPHVDTPHADASPTRVIHDDEGGTHGDGTIFGDGAIVITPDHTDTIPHNDSTHDDTGFHADSTVVVPGEHEDTAHVDSGHVDTPHADS